MASSVTRAGPVRRARRARLALAACVIGLVAGGGPGSSPAAAGPRAVVPSTTYQRFSFEGFDVIAHVPAHPRAMAYLFHGSHGSAAFADRVETTAVLNRLTAAGYGFVATSSTERTGDKRWDVSDTTPAGNPDLARLGRLQSYLVDTTPLAASTPLVGIGMSNGGRFVTLWGQAWKEAGFPVRAIWASMGSTATPYAAAGRLTVPTAFTTAVNDFTVPADTIVADWATARSAQTPTILHVSAERRLDPAQFLRIPGVDAAAAGQIVQALVATGVWNAAGVRVEPDVERAVQRAQAARLPASLSPLTAEIGDETALLLAVHQFTAEWAGRVTRFWARFVDR